MSDMNTNLPGRDLATITNEICFYKRQTELALLSGAIEIGRRLVEAKAMIGHGNWGNYLKEQVNFSQSTANNMMRLYEEYGTGQVSVFGNSQSIMNLDPTKALKLLAIPAEEREEFVAEHDVENKSVRELDEIIKERDCQLANARDIMHKQDEELQNARETIDQQDRDIATLEKATNEKAAEIDKLKDDLKAANDKVAEAKRKIKELKDNPTVPEDTMEQLRREAEAKATAEVAEKTAKKYESKIAKAEKDLKAANDALAEARQQSRMDKETADAALKQLKLASPKATEFKTLFSQAQDDFNKLIKVYTEIQMEDHELASSVKTAINTMLDQFKRYLEE